MTIAYTQGPWETKHHGEWITGRDPICGEVVVAKAIFNWKENARLISAAPELLEVLKDFSAYVRDEQNSTDGAVVYSNTQINRLAFKARAAIAKVEGEQK